MRTPGGAENSLAAPLRTILLLVIGLLLTYSLQISEAHVGVCYKTPGKNEPPPIEVVGLLEKHNIGRVRLYEPHQETLTALKGKDIQVMVDVPNSDLIPLDIDPAKIESWVQTNVKAYYPDVKFQYLNIGHDISTNNVNSDLTFPLVRAIQKFQNALSKEGLEHIKVTTAFDISILQNPYTDPPSNISFAPETVLFMDNVLKLLSNNSAPFMINIYPYYGHILNPKGLSLDYALFKASAGNLFEALVDSVYSALTKMGYDSIDVVVAETGWPSACGVSASVENQKTYITNLIEQVKKGTPMRPQKPIQTYLYSLFDEDVQLSPEVEKHWGLFTSKRELKFKFSGPLICLE